MTISKSNAGRRRYQSIMIAGFFKMPFSSSFLMLELYQQSKNLRLLTLRLVKKIVLELYVCLINWHVQLSSCRLNKNLRQLNLLQTLLINNTTYAPQSKGLFILRLRSYFEKPYLLDLGLIVKASKFQIEVDTLKLEYKCGC